MKDKLVWIIPAVVSMAIVQYMQSQRDKRAIRNGLNELRARIGIQPKPWYQDVIDKTAN